MTTGKHVKGRRPRFSDPDERRLLLEGLSAWQQLTGRADPPERAQVEISGRPRPYPVGVRLRTARTNYRAGRLPTQFVDELESLPGFTWQPSPHRPWQERYRAVAAYAHDQGSLAGLSTAQPALWRWLRQQIKDGGARLSSEQRQALQALPGSATLTPSTPPRSAATLAAALRIWLTESGLDDVSVAPYSATVEVDERTVAIGPRSAYIRDRYAQGKLTEADIAVLEALPGWTWTKPSERTENHPHFARLLIHTRAARTWMARTGSTSVATMPASATVTLDGQSVNVGQALKNYRTRHRAGKLPQSAIAILEQLPGYSPDPRRPGRKEART